MPIALIFFVFIVLFIVIAVTGHIQAKKRREALSNLGNEMGLRFDPTKDRSFDDQYPFFDALCWGDNRYAYNTLRGQFEGRSIVGFDYHYETSSRDSDGDRTTSSHHFSAVIFQSTLPLDGLTIRPEGFFDRMKTLLGFDDIDFESAEFSKQFHVKCRDRRMAYDVVQAETMEFMLAMPRFTLHFESGLVMVMRNQTFDPSDFRAAIHLVDGILDRIPESTREVLRPRS